jgi:hypothetical protein
MVERDNPVLPLSQQCRLLTVSRSSLSPWMRSLIQVPLAWTNSPAAIIAALPMTVIRSRCPRALTRRTQNPLSGL